MPLLRSLALTNTIVYPCCKQWKHKAKIQRLFEQIDRNIIFGKIYYFSLPPTPHPLPFWHSCSIIKDATLHMLSNYLPLDTLRVPRRCSAVYSGWYQLWEKPQPGTHAYEHRYPRALVSNKGHVQVYHKFSSPVSASVSREHYRDLSAWIVLFTGASCCLKVTNRKAK